MSHAGKNTSGVAFRLSVRSSEMVPSNGAILIAFGYSAPQYLSSNIVVFSSPNSEATASAAVNGGTLRVQLTSGMFSAGQLITFLLPNTLKNPATIQPSRNISISVVDDSDCVLAFNSSILFRSIVDGSLADASVFLNDWTAGGTGVTMTFSFTPSFEIPINSSILITLSGSAPQSISSSKVVFSLPSSGLPSAVVSLFNGVIAVFLLSGTFFNGQSIRFELPGTVTNPAFPQSAKVDITTAVLDSIGVVLCENSNGSMHPIVDGRLLASINFDWRGSGATSVSLSASIIAFSDVSQGSSIIISLMGSCPQSLSSNSVIFTSPSSGFINGSASLQNGVLTILVSSGTFSSGQLISFTLPKTMTNSATSQYSLSNVSVSIVNSFNATLSINRSVFFHAIHDSNTLFAHTLSGFTASAVGIKTFGSFTIQGASVGNVITFTYPTELFLPSRCKVFCRFAIFIFELVTLFQANMRFFPSFKRFL